MPNRTRKQSRQRRHYRIRNRVVGTASKPRFCVYVSSKHLYVQIIDDDCGRTLAAISTLDRELQAENVRSNMSGATIVGQKAAARAIDAGVKTVVFDRAGFKYHGMVREIAESARKAGLEF